MSKPSEDIRASVTATVGKQVETFQKLRDVPDVWSDDDRHTFDLHGLTDEQLRTKQMADPMNWVNAILEYLDAQKHS
jgi:hypothetical protein